MRKWANIRDSFQRSERKLKEHSNFGHGPRPNPYIHSDLLQFLKTSTYNTNIDEGVCNDAQSLPIPEFSENEEESSSVSELTVKKEFFQPSIDAEKEQFTENRDRNRHIAFFEGLLHFLDPFDEDEVIEFQLEVLNVVSDLRKKRNNPYNTYSVNNPDVPHNVYKKYTSLGIAKYLSSFHTQSSPNAKEIEIMDNEVLQSNQLLPEYSVCTIN